MTPCSNKGVDGSRVQFGIIYLIFQLPYRWSIFDFSTN
jgi:hypothetical protein